MSSEITAHGTVWAQQITVQNFQSVIRNCKVKKYKRHLVKTWSSTVPQTHTFHILCRLSNHEGRRSSYTSVCDQCQLSKKKCRLSGLTIFPRNFNTSGLEPRNVYSLPTLHVALLHVVLSTLAKIRFKKCGQHNMGTKDVITTAVTLYNHKLRNNESILLYELHRIFSQSTWALGISVSTFSI